MKILMVAAENDALPGGKVGGIGDVVRDIPVALARAGHEVEVLTPGYQHFSRLPGATRRGVIEVSFSGQLYQVDVFTLPSRHRQPGVTCWVLDHPAFAACGAGKIYCNDPPGMPYATDATKFALFCAAAAKGIITGVFGRIDYLHLHDWHAAMLAVLRRFHVDYRELEHFPTVYTIHNLALQGIRPLGDHESSLAAWYPGMDYDASQIADPRWPNCVNAMRAGITLSDKVHVVSPTYAREVKLASRPEQGFFGGEGLEADLAIADQEGRLSGILNGCEYPEADYRQLSKKNLISLISEEMVPLAAKKPVLDSALFIADKRLQHWAGSAKRGLVVTSVGRITDQKVTILQQLLPSGKTALDEFLEVLGDRGVFIMLGSGTTELEDFTTAVSARHNNFIFVKGYCEALSEALYASGDLFLMPSSFEPCGISQMLAMRAGQPCLVHRVGGLNDTVFDNFNGFCFEGSSLAEQATNMVETFRRILDLKEKDAATYRKIAAAAGASRYTWQDSIEQYLTSLYS